MRAEILGVGTELLLGQIANTNAQWMSERLAEAGVDVLRHEVVGDNLDRIVEAMRRSIGRVDVVLVTGGLGPTGDDLTRDALAAVLGVDMVRRGDIEELLREKFGRLGRDMPANNLRQADVPERVRAILPERGTAPGLAARVRDVLVYAVPGVPAEMREMMEATILPELREASGAVIASRTIRCAGIGESRAAEILEDLFDASRNPSIAYLASSGEVRIRVTAKARTPGEAHELARPLVDEIVRRLGDTVFTTEDETLEAAVMRLLVSSGRRLACAESLTGGGVAERLTVAPGASTAFVGSAVVYTAEAKRAILGVREETIEQSGVVSEAAAREMAAGARRAFEVDVAVSLTGAAGPEPHDGAPPGTVWLAIDADGMQHARGFRSPGDRDQVRKWAEQAALDLVRRFLEGKPLPVSERLT